MAGHGVIGEVVLATCTSLFEVCGQVHGDASGDM